MYILKKMNVLLDFNVIKLNEMNVFVNVSNYKSKSNCLQNFEIFLWFIVSRSVTLQFSSIETDFLIQ